MLSSIHTKIDLIKKYNFDEKNIGSSETQIILLTFQLNKLQYHFEKHKNDYHSKRGLLQLVSKRRKLLTYLKNKDIMIYNKLIEKLGLRR